MFSIFKSNEQKQYKQDVCTFFAQVNGYIEDLRRNCDPYQTMKLNYFKQYLNIYEQTSDHAKKILKDELNLRKFYALRDKWRELLKSQIIRIFQISDSYSGCVRDDAKGLEDLKEAILYNEAKFKARVQEAVNYFGDSFLKEQIWVCPSNRISSINAVNGPVTVEDILEESITDWKKLEIRCGHPQPYYHTMYNANLRYIVDKYI